MKLYTDECNLMSLRILAASKFGDDNLEIVKVKDKGSSKTKNLFPRNQLPVLEVEEGRCLFNANSSCAFLLSKDNLSVGESGKIDEVLEWDQSYFQCSLFPALYNALNTKKKIDEARLAEPLQILDELIGEKKFLASDEMSAADVAVWGTLCPVIMHLESALCKHASAQKWFDHMHSLPACAQAVERVIHPKAGLKSIYTSLELYISSNKWSVEPKESAAAKKSGQKSAQKGKPALSPTEPQAQSVVKVTQEEVDQAKSTWNSGRAGVATPRKFDYPKLPIAGEKNILITSALLYVNNVPHLGNIIGCVLSADVYSRFCRLRNYNSIYICGTDEYGTATETKAIEEGLTPQQICDKYNKIHTQIYKWFNIDFDYFGRTTTPQQTEITQEIFFQLHKQGNLKEDYVDQLKCHQCDRFLADRFVEGICPLCNYEDARGDQCDACGKLINATELKQPRCKLCGTSPKVESSKHIFLDLAKTEPKLKEFVDESIQKGKWTQNAQHITKGWFAEGLRPRCITRDLKWGVPVPLEGYQNKVFYVWFDAPIGYMSITANYTEDWRKWWQDRDNVNLVQFMAKDNVPFHTMVFPSTLLGANENYTLLNDISATEYLNYEDDKFSKSRGVGVFGDHAESTGIPADIFRFYLLYIRPESHDSVFSWSDLVTKNNGELLNNLGNFVNRASMFLKNFFDSTIQEMTLTDQDFTFIASVNKELAAYVEHLEKIRLRDGLSTILSITRLGNQYMQVNEPWVLVKGSEADKARAGTVISLSVNVACLTAVLLRPYMPQVSEEIQGQLNLQEDKFIITNEFHEMISTGHKIGDPYPLFKKLEDELAKRLKERFQGKKK